MTRLLTPLVVSLIALTIGVAPVLAQKKVPPAKKPLKASNHSLPTKKPTDADLMEALRFGYASLAMNLLRRGANPNALSEDKSDTALGYAASDGSRELVLELLKRGAQINPKKPVRDPPLVSALISEQLGIARLLIEKGADVNAGDNSLFGERPLEYAVKYEDLPLITLILDRGGEINHRAENGSTALATAAGTGNLSLVKFLQSRGAQIDKAADKNLHLLAWAINGGSLPIIDLVLANGYSLTETPNSLLLSAILSDKPAVIQRLLDAGADPETTDWQGNTALLLAVHWGRAESVKYLLTMKVNVQARNSAGQSALDMARTEISDDDVRDAIIAALHGAGAKPPINPKAQ